jgi:hypothetical protein
LSRGSGRPGGLLLTIALAVALGLYVLGIVKPMMIIHPGFGEHTSLIGYLNPEMTTPRVITLWQGLEDLWRQGAAGLACLLGVFSLGLPGLKFSVCFLSLVGRHSKPLVRFVHVFGFMSMAEVVFVSVFALTLKSLPGGTYVEQGSGLWLFFVSVLLLSAVTAGLHHELEVDATPGR